MCHVETVRNVGYNSYSVYQQCSQGYENTQITLSTCVSIQYDIN